MGECDLGVGDVRGGKRRCKEEDGPHDKCIAREAPQSNYGTPSVPF